MGTIWWTYLKRHELYGTALHILVLSLALGSLVHFQCSARITLRGRDTGSAKRQRPVLSRWAEEIGCKVESIFKNKGGRWLGLVAVTVVISLASLGAVRFVEFADLTNVDVSTKPENWSEADGIGSVTGARLGSSNLRKVNANGAFLVKADLYKANLQEAKLIGAKLQHADLNAARMQRAQLMQADLDQAKLSKANLKGANLTQANLQNASLTESILQETMLVETDLRFADLKEAELQGAVLVEAKLQEAKLEGAKLHGVNLLNARLETANLEGAILSNADLTGAILNGANLKKADLRGARNLTIEQLVKTRTLFQTFLDPWLSVQIGKNYKFLLQDFKPAEPKSVRSPKP